MARVHLFSPRRALTSVFLAHRAAGRWLPASWPPDRSYSMRVNVTVSRRQPAQTESEGSRRAPRLGLLLATALLLRDATSSDNATACSLNGEHRDGRCACDRGWRGVDCSQLDLEQSEIIYPSPARRPAAPPLTTAAWGASIVRDDAGAFHLFEDVVCQDYSPGFHEKNSNIQHLTSSSPTGPWRPVGFVVGAAAADGHTSNCPRIQRAPDGTWLLYHIAMSPSTQTNKSNPDNCSGYRPMTFQERRQRQVRRTPPTGKPKCGDNNETIRVAHSRSLSGPWELTYFKGKGSSYWSGTDGIEMPWDEGTNCWVDNPGSLVMMPNGT
jgi:hypothetical protein